MTAAVSQVSPVPLPSAPPFTPEADPERAWLDAVFAPAALGRAYQRVRVLGSTISAE